MSYTRIPTAYNTTESLVVEAENETAARLIVKDHIRDLSDMPQYVYKVKPYTPPPAGKIIKEESP